MQDFEHLLKAVKLKVTTPRLQILALFHLEHKHLSAEAIYKQLLKDNDNISLATIYRVLTQFEEVGLIAKSLFSEEHAVYELCHEAHHDHLICTECGIVEEFLDDVIEERQHLVAQTKNFLLQRHALFLYGICLNCQNRSVNTYAQTSS